MKKLIFFTSFMPMNSKTSATIYGIIGVIGSFIASIFGGWNASLSTLLMFMAIDWITGLIVAGVFHKSQKTDSGSLESKAGFKGLCRKGVMLLFVLIGYRIDISIGTNYIRDAICIAFIVNELISIIENAGLMGIPIPKIVIKSIDILKQKEESKTSGE